MINKAVLRLLIIIVSILGAMDSQASSDQDFEKRINEVVSEEGLIGVTWATISDQQVETGSFGFANVSKSQVMQAQQKMHVGSVSKSVLAIGVLRLITQGVLSLESNVELLLPELPFDNPWARTSAITVKHLLAHTAGIDNIRMWQFLNTSPLPDTPLAHAFMSKDKTLLKVRVEPGTQYLYSNMGYTLLAMVIERVTGQRYEAYLDNELLKPLEMHASTFEFVSQVGDKADPLLAMGYHENNVEQTAVAMYLRASGQFTTTAQDMVKYMAFVLSDGRLKGQTFVAPHLMTMLGYPDGTDAHQAGLDIGHGLAFAIRDRHGVVGMCHPGTTFGFRAYMCLFPSEQKGFFYAINTDSEQADYEKFNQLFITKLAIRKQAPTLAANTVQNELQLAGLYFLSPNSRVEFEFLDRLFNFIWLEGNGHNLTIKSLQSEDKRLMPIGENLYRDETRVQASHVLYQTQNGKLMLSDGLKTYQKGPITDILFYWVSLILGLLALLYLLLIGVYRLITRNRLGLHGVGLVSVNVSLFTVPAYFYSQQSFLAFGDVTAASISLALVSALLPISALYSLYLCFYKVSEHKMKMLDMLALVLLLVLCAVLFAWGQLPMTFWR
ncbi:serine hydrolase [Pseudoalteromonas sp. JBTF-M23]|uniref:Serine hydrolase n=1 Tax=Pseudoalteromonas caenipelagi TaxID=2726988 RepID=A0A849V6Q2_9GAMM|nr:serine hydrolase domain-containing protein [Pseudoalteromonas caenipelagi]NOU48992.1 serine hydrolase [Pseudoalteromonas caenipelagi]